MKNYFCIVALIALAAGQVHAAQVVERSKETRRLVDLRPVNRNAGANGSNKNATAPNQPAQVGTLNRKK